MTLKSSDFIIWKSRNPSLKSWISCRRCRRPDPLGVESTVSAVRSGLGVDHKFLETKYGTWENIYNMYTYIYIYICVYLFIFIYLSICIILYLCIVGYYYLLLRALLVLIKWHMGYINERQQGIKQWNFWQLIYHIIVLIIILIYLLILLIYVFIHWFIYLFIDLSIYLFIHIFSFIYNLFIILFVYFATIVTCIAVIIVD
jgi:hypothetical protein